MPLQNRVNPDGEICFSSARGTLMGNRGCIHNSQKEIVATSKRDAWVTCQLEFKGRKRKLMDGTNYTELFFLDEATALAAGHRPCAECRRDRFKAFMASWAEIHGASKVLATEVDRQMKRERAPSYRQEVANLADLPDGVIVKQVSGGVNYLVSSSKLYPWSFEGYGKPLGFHEISGPFIVLTPVGTVKVLANGYKAEIHSSANQN